MSEASPSKKENPFRSDSDSEQSDSRSHHSQRPIDRESPSTAPVANKESEQETKETDEKEKKKKGHFKKFWKYYTVGIVLGLVILLPLLLVKLAKRR